jgi:phosphoribosylpyrophosphate synthetase
VKENCVIFSLPDSEQLALSIANKLGIEIGVAEIRHFPDGESYIRIDSNIKNKIVLLVCRLDHPNNKILTLMFMAQTIKEVGENKICLISPYLKNPCVRALKLAYPIRLLLIFICVIAQKIIKNLICPWSSKK